MTHPQVFGQKFTPRRRFSAWKTHPFWPHIPDMTQYGSAPRAVEIRKLGIGNLGKSKSTMLPRFPKLQLRHILKHLQHLRIPVTFATFSRRFATFATFSKAKVFAEFATFLKALQHLQDCQEICSWQHF